MNQQLVNDNMKLVYFIVSKYYPKYIGDEDIIQAGMLGLCRAADTWDESKSQFSTYAGRCIRNEICMEFKQRNKHRGNLSLDYEMKDEDGESTLMDFIEGESDVDYIDTTPFVETLNGREKEIYSLLEDGLSQDEIQTLLGLSDTTVDTYIRRLRKRWREFYGD